MKNKKHEKTTGTKIEQLFIDDILENKEIEETQKDYSWKEVKVVGGKLNLRKNPRLDADVIKVLEEGTELLTDTKEGEWLHVLVAEDVYEGYVMSKFVE